MVFVKNLFGLNKDGSFKVWSICVSGSTITIKHGKEGGKLTTKTEEVLEGKQKRSKEEQAVFEATSKYKKQLDKGYRESKDDLSCLSLQAMLAQDARKKGHLIKYPCYTVNKLDGVRCLAFLRDGKVILQSRGNKEFTVPHLKESLSYVLEDGVTLDGEIYLHGEVLEDILSAVKRTDPEKEIEGAKRAFDKNPNEGTRFELDHAIDIKRIRDNLEFHVFDVMIRWSEDMTFDQRIQNLSNDCLNSDKRKLSTRYTTPRLCSNKKELLQHHKEAVEAGFEGIMIRNSCGVYESGKRSNDLLKYKEFLDDEFEIIGVNKDKNGNAVFTCWDTLANTSFEVSYGDFDQRKHQLEHKELYIGKWLKVKYQTRYKKTLLPQFPTGLGLREMEGGAVIE